VIVPLYGRIDLMEYQFALFSAHPAEIAHELIYVLDDPPKRTEMLELAESLLARYGIAFRLVLLSRNTGYAPANNIGLALARGREVCLLNSDVFPRDAGWLRRLSERLRGTPDRPAIGPLLLFEDGSVQHQGIEFEALPEFAGWLFPMHAGKGRRPGPARGLRRAPAITGACFMIARDTLRALGGLDEAYAIGDFEDVDLCMRLAERGMSCAVDLDVAMYHLERQSQAGPVLRWRMNLTLANAWLHHRRWGAALARAAAR
jgi:GT2 family glycosyltransferase